MCVKEYSKLKDKRCIKYIKTLKMKERFKYYLLMTCPSAFDKYKEIKNKLKNSVKNICDKIWSRKMADITKKSVIGNFIWRFAERCGAQLVTFIVSIVLARILDPKDYGTIALVTVFTTILQVFVDSGLGTALIQKKMQMIWIFVCILFQFYSMHNSLCRNVYSCTIYCVVL